MPNNDLHKKLSERAFGKLMCPFIPVDKQMDRYSQKLPGIRHRHKGHDPLRAGDYDDPLSKFGWGIVYRWFHCAIDIWWTNLSKESRKEWVKKIKDGQYPFLIYKYFWQIIECVAKDPLSVYALLLWQCDPLPSGWEEYIKVKTSEGKWVT